MLLIKSYIIQSKKLSQLLSVLKLNLVVKRYYPGSGPRLPSNQPSNPPSNPNSNSSGALIPYTKPPTPPTPHTPKPSEMGALSQIKNPSSEMALFSYKTQKAIRDSEIAEAVKRKMAQDIADKEKARQEATLKQNMVEKKTPVPTDATQLSPVSPMQIVTENVVSPVFSKVKNGVNILGGFVVSLWNYSSSKETTVTTVTPVPPVPPVTPVTPTLPTTPATPQTAIVPQTDMASENATTLETDAADVTKVSSELGSGVAAVTYKTQSGLKYTTTMTTGTTQKNITDSELIDEMRKRELIKPDLDCTAVVVKTIDDTDFLLGGSKNKVKLSPLGQAYYSKVSLKVDDNALQENKVPDVLKKHLEYLIVTPPKGNANVFVEISLHKHLLIVHDTCKDLYFGLTYLTSKHSGKLLSNQQLKAFQDQQENKKSSNAHGKQQRIVPLDRSILINKADVHRVKWDKEYIDSLPKDSKEYLQNIWKEIQMQPYKFFNFDGITKQDCINMCLEHDETAKKKGKHPLTEDQIKQNEANKNKQLQKNQAKKDADNNLINTPFT